MSVTNRVGDLGGYLREQRQNAKLSLRQLASLAGVSNPYLSQVERGLRRPSAEVLQQIARGLRISAEALYVRAGILDEDLSPGVEAAVHTDSWLTDRQKRVLLDIYTAFRAENEVAEKASSGAEDSGQGSATDDAGSDATGSDGTDSAGTSTPRPAAAAPARSAARSDQAAEPDTESTSPSGSERPMLTERRWSARRTNRRDSATNPAADRSPDDGSGPERAATTTAPTARRTERDAQKE